MKCTKYVKKKKKQTIVQQTIGKWKSYWNHVAFSPSPFLIVESVILFFSVKKFLWFLFFIAFQPKFHFFIIFLNFFFFDLNFVMLIQYFYLHLLFFIFKTCLFSILFIYLSPLYFSMQIMYRYLYQHIYTNVEYVCTRLYTCQY